MSSTSVVETGSFIDEAAIDEALAAAGTKDAGRVREILAKALELKGLAMDEVAVLTSVSDPDLLGELFAAARDVKDAIYGAVSCCSPRSTSPTSAPTSASTAPSARATRSSNAAPSRRTRSATRSSCSSTRATSACCSWPASRTRKQGFDYVLDVHRHDLRGQARQRRDPPRQRQRRPAHGGRVPRAQGHRHRHLPALPGDLPPRHLRAVHLGGKKKDYDWRVTGMDRAMKAGIDDVGIGVLFGLFDWRFEVLALMQHMHAARTRLRRGAAHDQRAAARAGVGSRHGRRAAAARGRRRLPQDRRDPAPGRALHRHHHVHARDAQHPARDLRARRVADLAPAAAPTPAATPRTRSSTRRSSSWAITATSTR